MPGKWCCIAQLATVLTALSTLLVPDIAFAQDCRAMAKGPAKKACIEQNNPAMLQAKRERCRASVEAGTSRGTKGARQARLKECMLGSN